MDTRGPLRGDDWLKGTLRGDWWVQIRAQVSEKWRLQLEGGKGQTLSLWLSVALWLCAAQHPRLDRTQPWEPALTTSVLQVKKLRLSRAQEAAQDHAAGSSSVGTGPRAQSLAPEPTLSHSMLSTPSRPRRGLQARELAAGEATPGPPRCKLEKRTLCIALLHGTHEMQTVHYS